MRVLIAAIDIYAATGGGETFYTGLIENNPNIEFSFFRWSEERRGWDLASDRVLPTNVRPIEVNVTRYRSRAGSFEFDQLRIPLPDISMINEAGSVAEILD